MTEPIFSKAFKTALHDFFMSEPQKQCKCLKVERKEKGVQVMKKAPNPSPWTLSSSVMTTFISSMMTTWENWSIWGTTALQVSAKERRVPAPYPASHRGGWGTLLPFSPDLRGEKQSDRKPSICRSWLHSPIGNGNKSGDLRSDGEAMG